MQVVVLTVQEEDIRMSLDKQHVYRVHLVKIKHKMAKINVNHVQSIPLQVKVVLE